jgi:Holliday junction resolvase RusA-like endonuclease
MQKRLIKKKGENMTQVHRLNIPPCPKPRMTKADRWRKRQSVLKFFAFRDAVRQSPAWKTLELLDMESFEIEFHVPMPKSWSKKKKGYMNGSAHQQRPDLDNYLKAWKDSVYEEDAVVWRVKASKLWTDGTGHIVVNYL